jgi:hypothetical protein
VEHNDRVTHSFHGNATRQKREGRRVERGEKGELARARARTERSGGRCVAVVGATGRRW